MVSNKNIKSVECLNCDRSIPICKNLIQAILDLKEIYCKECKSDRVKILYGNKCRFHGENTQKGYCNKCANDELKDNQI